MFSSQQKVWTFRRSLEFVAGLLCRCSLSTALAALAAHSMRLELPQVDEGDL